MLKEEKELLIQNLKEELARVESMPTEETISEYDASMRGWRICTTTNKPVATVCINHENVHVKEIWLWDWLFQEGLLGKPRVGDVKRKDVDYSHATMA